MPLVQQASLLWWGHFCCFWHAVACYLAHEGACHAVAVDNPVTNVLASVGPYMSLCILWCPHCCFAPCVCRPHCCCRRPWCCRGLTLLLVSQHYVWPQIKRQPKSVWASSKIFPWRFGLHAASRAQPWPRKCVLYVYIFWQARVCWSLHANVAHLWFLRDVWIRNQKAASASRRATNVATHFPKLGCGCVWFV